MNKDLGPSTCAYAEDEVVAALAEEELVRDEVVVRHLGLSLGLVRARQGFGLNWETDYGGMSRSLPGSR